MIEAYINDMAGFVDGSFRVERKASINFGGDFAGNDIEDFPAELYQKSVKGCVNLLVDIATLGKLSAYISSNGVKSSHMFLAVFNCRVD